MKLKDLCVFSTEFPDADFWIVNKGTEEEIGSPTKTFDPEYIGVKVTRTDILVPGYLYYAFMYLKQNGVLSNLAKEVNGKMIIKISDIKEIPIG
jgi:hypothetical protein